MAGENGHAWDIPAKNYYGLMDWRGIPPALFMMASSSPPFTNSTSGVSSMQHQQPPVLSPLVPPNKNKEGDTAERLHSIAFPTKTSDLLHRKHHQHRHHHHHLLNNDEDSTEQQQEEDNGAVVAAEEKGVLVGLVPPRPAEQNDNTTKKEITKYYHPTINKLDIVMLEESGELVKHYKIRGNNRLRVLLQVSKKNKALMNDEYERSRLAEELVQVIQDNWKGSIYYCIPETKKCLRLERKLVDEEDAYEAILRLVEQDHGEQDLDDMLQDWKHAVLSRRRGHKKMSSTPEATKASSSQSSCSYSTTSSSPASLPPYDTEIKRSRSSDDEDRNLSTRSDNATKKKRRRRNKEEEEGARTESSGKVVFQQDVKTKQEDACENSFLPSDYVKELSDMRHAAIASLKHKQERDLAFRRRDDTRSALLASQHDLIGFVHLESEIERKESSRADKVAEQSSKQSSASSTPPIAPAWRELSALEALCSMVGQDTSSNHDGESYKDKKPGAAVDRDSIGMQVVGPGTTSPFENVNGYYLTDACEQVHSSSRLPASPTPQGSCGRPKPEVAWNAMFERLCKYRQVFGDCLVPYSWKHDRKLGDWVSVQRKRYKKGILQTDRVERLEAVGFVWALRQQEPWDSMFERLVEFKRVHGHLVVPQSRGKLARWVVDQRNHMRRGRLAQDRTDKLEAIGFLSKAWQQKSEAREQLNGSFSPSLSASSSKFIQDDQDVAEGGESNTEKILTTTCGENEQERRDNYDGDESVVGLWDEHMFRRLLAFRQVNGHCWVPEPNVHDPLLGRWVCALRSNKEALSCHEINKLESIGFVFSVLHQLPWDNMVQHLHVAGRTTTNGHF